MKKFIYLVVVFYLVACNAVKQNPNQIQITSKKEVVTNDFIITIDKIISDSRCPEGTNCVWAGVITMKLSVLKGKELKESTVMTFSYQNLEENMKWFSKYIPSDKKLLKCFVSPVKTEKNLELKDYKVELILE